MSYVPREERARRSRQAQFANGQRPGGSDVEARQRRSSEAELQTSQRVGEGQEVDADGRAQVKKDKTIRVDSRNRHAVVPDNLRFETPVDGSQAATKDYVDSQIADSGSGTAFRKQYSILASAVTLTTSYQAIRTVSFQSELDLDSLLRTGVNGILAQTGHYYLGTFSCQVLSTFTSAVPATFSLYTPADATYTLPIQWAIEPYTIQRQVSGTTGGEGVTDIRFHALVNLTGYTAVAEREVYAIGLASSGVVVSRPKMSLQRLHPYDQSDATAPLPPIGPLVDFFADKTSVATRVNIKFTDLTVGEVDTWAWDFGDGTTSALQNPQKAYTVAGTYTVSLTAGGGGVTNTETKTSYITVT